MYMYGFFKFHCRGNPRHHHQTRWRGGADNKLSMELSIQNLTKFYEGGGTIDGKNFHWRALPLLDPLVSSFIRPGRHQLTTQRTGTAVQWEEGIGAGAIRSVPLSLQLTDAGP